MGEFVHNIKIRNMTRSGLHVLIWILAVSLYMAFNYIPFVGTVIILLTIASLALNGKSQSKHELITTGIIVLCMMIGMFTKQFSFRRIIITVTALCSLFNIVLDTVEKKKAVEKRSVAGVVIGSAGYLFSVMIFAGLLYNSVNPDAFIVMLQNGAGKYPQNITETYENRDGVAVFRDVTYDSDYPNNTYTVYSLPKSKGVFFYIHGGGLVIGDKETDAQNIYLNSMMDAGYSVVTVDYVLASQNPFPQSVYEVNDALAYFIRHVDDYGLTADRIIVGGDSAGGMLSGLLAVINTNSKYAQELGVTAAVEGTDVTVTAARPCT